MPGTRQATRDQLWSRKGRCVKGKHFIPRFKGGRGEARKEGRTVSDSQVGSRWVIAESCTVVFPISHLLNEEVGAVIKCSEKSRQIT